MSIKSAQTTLTHIFMGDVSNSAAKDAPALADDLRAAVAEINTRFATRLLSPLTVTLGDEFQGLPDSAETTIAILFALETLIRDGRLPALHYAWVHGTIDTAINPDIAHGMLGPGLSRARALLTRKDRDRPVLQTQMPAPALTTLYDTTAAALFAISARWNPRDYRLISDLLSGQEIKDIAAAHDRDTSSVYRRRDTLMIDAYADLQQAMTTLAACSDRGTFDV